MEHKPKLGSGKRFSRLKAALAHKPGVTDPAALAASIGRKKYGNVKMEHMSIKHMVDGGEDEVRKQLKRQMK